MVKQGWIQNEMKDHWVMERCERQGTIGKCLSRKLLVYLMSDKNDAHSESYYRLIAESSRDIIITHDVDGRVIYVNAAWTELTGFSASEVIGRSIENFVAKSSIPDLEERQRQRRSGDESVLAYEVDLVGKDGEKIPLEVWSSTIKKGNGDAREILLICRDVRQQQQTKYRLKDIEASYEDLFNAIDDAIYIQDREGRFLDVNRGAERMYGLPKEAFIGKKPDFLAAPGKNDFEAVGKSVELAFEGTPQEFEFWGIRNKTSVQEEPFMLREKNKSG